VSNVQTLERVIANHAAKFLRYCGVSVFNLLFGQALLLVFFRLFGFTAWIANLLAIAVGTGPAYFLARHYVWQKRGKHSFAGEVLPFWGLNLLGTVLSTLSVHVAETVWDRNALAITAASIGAWMFVWVLKYFTLDRAVFRAKEREAIPIAG
jgi:putative flippase GtrA